MGSISKYPMVKKLYKMILDKLQSPIFVTGIERSGSSIVARIIKSCGVFTGEVTEMQENKKIKSYVDDFYTKQIGIPANGQFPLPDFKSTPIPIDWKYDVENFLMKDGYIADKSWMYKSSRIAQIWHIWNHFYPNSKWLIVRRRTGDITYSCLKTAYMSAFANEANRRAVNANTEQEGWLWWVHEHEKLFVEMIEAGLNVKVIWPERMAGGDFTQIAEMLEWLGLQWHDGIVDSVVPLLKNSTQKERSV